MTMGMNKNHRPFAQRPYQPGRVRWMVWAVIAAIYAGMIAWGVHLR